jgi:hypothetical protein
MVIYNLNIKYISGCPGKTDTPLFVDTDAVLAFPVSFERLQTIAWRRPQEVVLGIIQHNWSLSNQVTGHSVISKLKAPTYAEAPVGKQGLKAEGSGEKQTTWLPVDRSSFSFEVRAGKAKPNYSASKYSVMIWATSR